MEFTIEELELIHECICCTHCEGFGNDKTMELEERIYNYLKEVKGDK